MSAEAMHSHIGNHMSYLYYGGQVHRLELLALGDLEHEAPIGARLEE